VPRDISAELAAQVEALRAKLTASEDAAAAAAREVEEARPSSETAQERAKRESEERALWEKLASEEEAAAFVAGTKHLRAVRCQISTFAPPQQPFSLERSSACRKFQRVLS
jgi:type I restriction enzyme R subunit